MERSIIDLLEHKSVVKNAGFGQPAISTDTRTIRAGSFYIPLQGKHFNGEMFIDKAVEAGAAGFITTKQDIADKFANDKRVRWIALVENTAAAYMELAAARIKEKGFKVIGITGSSGKTTTKEMIYAVSAEKFRTHKTAQNNNNEIGFCQTVFEAPDDTQVLIVEMGMRGLGEIELIAKYAKPDIAIITNAGTAHIGRLGSRENIAKAKCEIAAYLNQNGVLIANNDELIKNTVKFNGKKYFYSINDTIIKEQRAGCIVFEYNNFEYELPIEGIHNVEDALAAINTGIVLGIPVSDIKEGLKKFQTIENRWNVEKIGNYQIINDCYNANPDSMKAACGTILDIYPSPVLILGDMGELGADSKKYHSAIGEFLNNHPKMCGTVCVLTVGILAKEISKNITKCVTKNFENIPQISDYILKNKNIGNILFFKASRSMRFEDIIRRIKGEL